MLDRTYIFYPSHCKLFIFLSPNFLHVRELLSKLFWYNRPSQNIKYTIRSNKVNIVGVKHLTYFTSVVSGSFVLRSRMLIVVFPFGCLILRNVKSVAECCNDINHFGCWQDFDLILPCLLFQEAPSKLSFLPLFHGLSQLM